ncbi:MAG: phosphoenolpyruvate carboxykinase (GTP) [Oligoflexia bacterium]|nr:phosphoenolpyruvate carboxykinase (GTP) [Oligoflexia bacterium]
MASPTANPNVLRFVDETAARLHPDKVVWIDGSEKEAKWISDTLVADGTFVPLNKEKFPNCFWSVSDPSDVARVEDRTFICSRSQEDAGPTNNWCEPREMFKRLSSLMESCMRGRTMYVVPYLMGPDGSPYSRVGFELTDSLYVVANMRIMARIGEVALKNLPNNSNEFVRGIHSIGNLDPEHRYICHFPEYQTIVSFNSNYGGNALQGKKCFALRIASTLARRQNWLAEHMLILGITNPKGEKQYFCAAFPSACGKTNLAMLIPPEGYKKAGWKIETVGDDIAWLNFGSDGRLWAINPEAGFFGVAPGTSYKTNPNAMDTIKSNTIFTNTALDLDTMCPWWEGLGEPPPHLKDWMNREWSPASKTKAAHANSRFTAPARQCPCIDPEWESPRGVPISAIIFGGRRARTAPLVYEARSWRHGTFVGVTMASETTAAATGKVGELRRDPMAMLPFIGYHAGDYFQHWLNMGQHGGDKMPRIFHVNWFRQDETGKFLWPGFGENIRVLEWIFNRINGTAGARESALGLQPRMEDLNVAGLGLTQKATDELFAIYLEDWAEELESQENFLKKIGTKLPGDIWMEHYGLRQRLGIIA